jgi:hypothetical protein
VKAQSKHGTAAQEKRARRSGQFTSAFGWIPAGCKPKKMETPSLELSAFNSKENPSYQQTWLSNT